LEQRQEDAAQQQLMSAEVPMKKEKNERREGYVVCGCLYFFLQIVGNMYIKLSQFQLNCGGQKGSSFSLLF
jgi:hypothetical protein